MKHNYSKNVVKKILFLFVLVTSGVLMFSPKVPRTLASGTIVGTVYVDYNMNGARNTSGTSPNFAVDSAVSGVTVTVFDSSGASKSALTDANGNYSIDTAAAPALLNGPYRIEFTTLPTGYSPSVFGSNNGSSVIFVPDGDSSGNDFGIIQNSDYCQDNPLTATPQYINGDNESTDPVLMALNYDRTGSLITFGQATNVGATWALAWKSKEKKLLASSVLKRHSGFGPGRDGTRDNQDDISTIYVYDYNTPGMNGEATIVPGEAIDLGFLGVSVGANPRVGSIPANDLSTPLTPNHDYDVFENVGRRGIGGMALSQDQNTLYVVNLNSAQPQLVSLNVTDLSDVTLNSAINIPNPGCPGTDSAAPWAVKVNQGQVYVGTVCTADVSQSSANLRAYLLRLNGASFETVDLDSTSANNYVSLGYDRSFGYYLSTTTEGGRSEWRPWLAAFPTDINNPNTLYYTYATPIFSDMEFGTDGTVTIGLMDRTGMQIGYVNYSPTQADTTLYTTIVVGDILRVCNVSGNYIPEGQPGCTQPKAELYDRPDGFGGTPTEITGIPREFYNDDAFDSPTDGHFESFFGGLSKVPGYNEIITTSMNPAGGFNNGGYRWYSTSNGSVTSNYRIYQNAGNINIDDTLGKSVGLGDIAFLCDVAPLQVGNRIWNDTDNDGIQEPGELPISGVTVQLWADTDSNGSIDTLIGTATTDANGNYIFGGVGNINLLPTFVINPSTAHQVRIPASNFNTGGPLAIYRLSPANSDNSTNGDSRDSDGTLSAGNVIADFTSGDYGQNNHTYDFGFNLAPTAANVSVGGRVRSASGVGLSGILVSLVDGNGDVRQATTNSFGYYRFDQIEVGQTVTVTVSSRRAVFSNPTQIITLQDNALDINFTADNSRYQQPNSLRR